MPSKSDLLADELRTLADDMKQVLVTLRTDPKEQRNKELQWRLLYGGLSAVFAVVGRKLATRAWHVLTGEQPPTKANPQGQAARPARPEREEAGLVSVPASEQETAVGASG
jgi:hypothetical protein